MKETATARYAFDGLERVMHEKARPGVIASLTAHPDGLAFTDLKELCALTDGNLSRHLQVLHEAGLVSVRKSFKRNRPHTACRLTAKGRRRFLEYLFVLERIVLDTATAAEGEGAGAFDPRTV